MNPNDTQVGGDHYQKEYQHWDWVDDLGLHYYLGCATKYVSRWREKNGIQDLEKAIHYLEKAIQKNTKVGLVTPENNHRIYDFTHQFGAGEGLIIRLITLGEFEEAKQLIKDTINLNKLNEEYIKG